MLTKDIKVGRLLARALDSFTPRTGTNTWHPMQRITLLNASGVPVRWVCLIEVDHSRPAETQNTIVENFMRVLDTGIRYAEIEKRESPANSILTVLRDRNGNPLFAFTIKGEKRFVGEKVALQLRDELIRLLA